MAYDYNGRGELVRASDALDQVAGYEYDRGLLVEEKLKNGLRFYFDALGRRLSKRNGGQTTRWVWDGNVPLHEWITIEDDRGTTDEVTTWLFEDDSFAPMAKLKGSANYSVVTDHLGTPLEMHSQAGVTVWSAELDSYGRVRRGAGDADACPFRYQGQYEDQETDLYYNRFRYYDPESGQYISQDPIKLRGGSSLYGYVLEPNSHIDPFGLAKCKIEPATGPDHDIVLKLSKRDCPETAGHIEEAVAKGHPDILTINRPGAAANRKASLKGYRTKSGSDRDEWPMAMGKEGGKGADVKYINPSDNRGAGSTVGSALGPYPDGTKVKFVITD